MLTNGPQCLLKALKNCEKLERLVICSYGNFCSVNMANLTDLLLLRKSLLFAAFIFNTFTNKDIAVITKEKKFKSKRPSYLCVRADKFESEKFLKDIPYVFFKSMISYESWALSDDPV